MCEDVLCLLIHNAGLLPLGLAVGSREQRGLSLRTCVCDHDKGAHGLPGGRARAVYPEDPCQLSLAWKSRRNGPSDRPGSVI